MRTPASTPVLALSRLRKSVPGGRVLFDDLDLQVARGELVAIMGESGAGKSTLLNIVAGLDEPDAGTCLIEGTELSGLDENRRTLLRRDRIGFVFQAFHVLPHLTLSQNVALPRLHDPPHGADRPRAHGRSAPRRGDVRRRLSRPTTSTLGRQDSMS